MTDLSALLAHRLAPFANGKSSNTPVVSVDDSGQFVVLGNRTLFILVTCVGPNVPFISFTGAASLNGSPLPVLVGQPFDVEAGTRIDLICSTGETAEVHIIQLQGRTA